MPLTGLCCSAGTEGLQSQVQYGKMGDPRIRVPLAGLEG